MATITLSTSKNDVNIELRGTGSASISWGDGKSNSYALMSTNNVKCSHIYSGSATRTITITGNVTYLKCDRNELKTLNVSNNTLLTILSCCSNALTSLDVSKNTQLLSLTCYSNKLAVLDVSKNTRLTSLDCGANPLKAFDISKNTELVSLYCDALNLTSLNLTNNKKLRVLYCYNNKLTALSLSGLTSLASLNCSSNQLTALSLSGLTSLVSLNCYNNKLTALSLSGLTSLASLNCSTNQLTALSLSGLSMLVTVRCINNKMSAAALNNLFVSLRNVPQGITASLYINNNPGTGSSIIKTALDKNWKSDYIPSNTLTLDKTILKLQLATSASLSVVSGDSSGQLKWSSSNPAVASVDTRGNVSGKDKGIADIVVKSADGLKESACKVYVYEKINTALGCGINILEAESVTNDFINGNNPVIDAAILNAVGKISFNPQSKKTTFEVSIAESVLDVINEFNSKNKVGYSGAFSVSAEVNFNTKRTENRTSKFIKAKGEVRIRKESIQNTSINYLKDFLSEQFVLDCVNKSAEIMLKTYGSHIIASCYLGGIAVVDAMYTSSKITTNQALEVNVKGSFGGFSASSDNKSTKDRTHFRKNTTEKIAAWGGDISATTWEQFNAQYDKWYSSIEKSPAVCGIDLFNEETNMLPLWKFVKLISPNKGKQVEDLFNKKCEEREVKLRGLVIYNPVVTDINVFAQGRNLSALIAPYNHAVLETFTDKANDKESFEESPEKILDCNKHMGGSFINILYKTSQIPSYNDYTGRAISDIIMLKGKDAKAPKGYTKISIDLNQGGGSKSGFLYLGFKRATATDSEVIDFIGGKIYDTKGVGSLPTSKEGRWEWMSQRNAAGARVDIADLNEDSGKGASSKYIRLVVHKIKRQK